MICGTGDSTSEAISVGIVKPGRVMFQFGSSLFFYYCADRKVYDHRIHGGNFTVPVPTAHRAAQIPPVRSFAGLWTSFIPNCLAARWRIPLVKWLRASRTCARQQRAGHSPLLCR